MGRAKKRLWKCEINLEPLIGKGVSIETHDGIFREGRLTGLLFLEVTIDGKEVRIPKSIELNGDSFDQVELAQVRVLDVH